MASFDISSELDWQELDNAVNIAVKEVANRFDFKGVKTEIKLDLKAKTISLWSSAEGKLDALNDIFQNKVVKRGISLLSFDYQKPESAFGGSAKQTIVVMAGISKEKGKEIIKAIKESKLKVQAQIQDEQVRVSSKKKDDLQETMSFLKTKQNQLKIPMNFGNFRN